MNQSKNQIDESLTKETQNCKVNLLLQYFESDDIVKVKIYDSRFLGRGTHFDLMQQFNDVTKDLNPNHMYQMPIKDPSVNFKFYDCTVIKREENEQHVLVDIGTCGLHTIHRSFNYDGGKSNWNFKKIIKGYDLQDPLVH